MENPPFWYYVSREKWGMFVSWPEGMFTQQVAKEQFWSHECFSRKHIWASEVVMAILAQMADVLLQQKSTMTSLTPKKNI